MRILGSLMRILRSLFKRQEGSPMIIFFCSCLIVLNCKISHLLVYEKWTILVTIKQYKKDFILTTKFPYLVLIQSKSYINVLLNYVGSH